MNQLLWVSLCPFSQIVQKIAIAFFNCHIRFNIRGEPSPDTG
ncbi:MAG: hypothetical protein AB1589_21090 [Cyanobacteriota bacterium]